MPEQRPPATGDEMVAVLGWITGAFCLTLGAVALMGVLFVVPDPVLGARGLAVGCVLALLAWRLPVLAIRLMLASARRAGLDDAGVPGVVRTAVLAGIGIADTPALLALLLAVADGHDVGALVVAAPVAIASLLVNVSGPRAVRRHLERARG